MMNETEEKTDTAFDRLPDEVKHRYWVRKAEEEQACSRHVLKIRHRHAKLAAVGAVIYLLVSTSTLADSGIFFDLLMGSLGGAAAFLISWLNLERFVGMIVFTLPNLLTMTIVLMLHSVNYYAIVVIFGWLMLISIGGILGYLIEFSE